MTNSFTINRRAFLRAVSGAGLAALLRPGAFGQIATPKNSVRPLMGAIRWDAWYDPANGSVAQAVEKSLGPAQYHYRMPFFGQVTEPNSVRINGFFQDIIDKEITCAVSAGLDYWAFVSYSPDDPMSNALKLYLSSRHRLLPDCRTDGKNWRLPSRSAMAC